MIFLVHVIFWGTISVLGFLAIMWVADLVRCNFIWTKPAANVAREPVAVSFMPPAPVLWLSQPIEETRKLEEYEKTFLAESPIAEVSRTAETVVKSIPVQYLRDPEDAAVFRKLTAGQNGSH